LAKKHKKLCVLLLSIENNLEESIKTLIFATSKNIIYYNP